MSEVPLYSSGSMVLVPAGRMREMTGFPLRALLTETNVESGTSQSKSGTSVNLCNSGNVRLFGMPNRPRQIHTAEYIQGYLAHKKRPPPRTLE